LAPPEVFATVLFLCVEGFFLRRSSSRCNHSHTSDLLSPTPSGLLHPLLQLQQRHIGLLAHGGAQLLLHRGAYPACRTVPRLHRALHLPRS
jgi:hypothetical protein